MVETWTQVALVDTAMLLLLVFQYSNNIKYTISIDSVRFLLFITIIVYSLTIFSFSSSLGVAPSLHCLLQFLVQPYPSPSSAHHPQTASPIKQLLVGVVKHSYTILAYRCASATLSARLSTSSSTVGNKGNFLPIKDSIL